MKHYLNSISFGKVSTAQLLTKSKFKAANKYCFCLKNFVLAVFTEKSIKNSTKSCIKIYCAIDFGFPNVFVFSQLTITKHQLIYFMTFDLI